MDKLNNYINGRWVRSDSSEYLPIINPATAETIANVPLSHKREIESAALAAATAYASWRQVPATSRIQYLFKLKQLLEENFEEIARIIEVHLKIVR